MRSHSPEGKTWRGIVTQVTEERTGSALRVDAAASDGVVKLESAGWARHGDDAGGYVGKVTFADGANVETVRYKGVHPQANELVGVEARANSYDSGETFVRAYPFQSTLYASVQPDGSDGTVYARVPYSFRDVLVPGSRDVASSQGEGVVVQHDGNEWVVVDVLGKTPAQGSEVLVFEVDFAPDDSVDTSPPYYGTSGTLYEVWAHCDDGGPLSLIEVLVNGAVVASLSLGAGDTDSDHVRVEPGVAFKENDTIKVRLTP